jgi:hypothetical protein
MIKLGYEIGTGREVSIPLRHTAVTGQTQESGKTTTLEAIIQRSGGQSDDGTYKQPLQSVAFITKRGEKSFRLKNTIRPYFREPEITNETPMWEWIGSILEAAIDQKIGKEEQAAIIQASDRILERRESKGKNGESKRKLEKTTSKVQTLEHVHHNIQLMVDQERGSFKRACICLDAYFQKVMPQIRKIKSSAELVLRPGINVMDLEDLTDEMQALIIRSVIETVYRKRKNTVVIVPESAKFIPNRRSSPVRFAAEMFIRQGLGIGNVLMLDSQDLANVATEVLKSVGVWILGKQTEINEVRRVVDYIPAAPKIAPIQIQQLGRGEFFAVYSDQVRKVYVQPAGMEDVHAKSIALGEESADSWKAIERRLEKDSPADDYTAPENMVDDSNPPKEPDALVVSETERELVGPVLAGDPARPKTSDQRGAGESAPGGTPAASEYDEMVSIPRIELKRMQDQIEELLSTQIQVRGELAADRAVRAMPSLEVKAIALNGNMAEFLRQLRAHPEVVHVLLQQPTIRVNVERPVVEVGGKSIAGRAALLVHDGFFKEAHTGSAAYQEMIRRGWGHDKRSVYRELDSLAEMGFLTKEEAGYLAVSGMKLERREVKA